MALKVWRCEWQIAEGGPFVTKISAGAVWSRGRWPNEAPAWLAFPASYFQRVDDGPAPRGNSGRLFCWGLWRYRVWGSLSSGLAALLRVGFRRWPLAGRRLSARLGADLCHVDGVVERAAMFIDVQGFGALYGGEADSLWGLSELMEGVYRLGRESERIGIPRLFAHHIGDGFVLVDDGGVASVNRLVAAAVALHQFTLVKAGHFCASAIDRGGMADVVGCYPRIVTEARIRDGVVPLGDGLMTIFPVMGTAIINTHRLLARAHGAVILLPESHAASVEAGIRSTVEDGLLHVDWLASDSATIAAARDVLGLGKIGAARLAADFDAAVHRNGCKPEWVARTSRFLARPDPDPQAA